MLLSWGITNETEKIVYRLKQITDISNKWDVFY